MHIAIVTVGDELLLGQIDNDNATWIAEQLSLVQLVPDEIVVSADRKDAITNVLRRLWDESELIVITGGLGPTPDDVTRSVVAEYLDRSLVFQSDVYEEIVERLTSRGVTVTDAHRQLAMVPEGFEVLKNNSGTAPGLWYENSDISLVLLPGVPQEMKTLMREHVLPRVEAKTEFAYSHRILRTTGLPESAIHDQLEGLDQYTDEFVQVAFLPELGGVRLRLTGRGEEISHVEERLDRLEEYMQGKLGLHLYSTENENLEVVVGRLLKEKAVTLAVAESCTGGALASRITDVPGSSAYLAGGIIAYSNSVKVNLLDVASDALDTEGAVSSVVARQMAAGIRDRLGTDLGVATTGVAGPSGGTPEKPVGTVWIGYADAEGVKAHRLHFSQNRLANKELSVVAVLDMVRRRLIGRSDLS